MSAPALICASIMRSSMPPRTGGIDEKLLAHGTEEVGTFSRLALICASINCLRQLAHERA